MIVAQTAIDSVQSMSENFRDFRKKIFTSMGEASDMSDDNAMLKQAKAWEQEDTIFLEQLSVMVHDSNSDGWKAEHARPSDKAGGSSHRITSHNRPQTTEEIVARVRYLDKGGTASFAQQTACPGARFSGDPSSSSSDEGGNGGRNPLPPVPPPQRRQKPPVSLISRGPVIAGNTVITSQFTPSGVIQYENDALHRLKRWIREHVGTAITAPEIKGFKMSVPDAYSGTDSISDFEEWLGHVLRYYRLL
jgi:hypothetical protein